MSKKIIFCADGTWNTPHGAVEHPTDTNVRKLFLLLNDDSTQLKYYDSGVGTNGTFFENLMGGSMGRGLFQKVQDGYAFLSYVWDPGDEIYLFGFSRGAYTARSLAGMLALFGVPTKDLDNQTASRIFDAYRITDRDQRKAAKAELASQYGLTDVQIRMVGVWDTVGALGVPGKLFDGLDEKKYGFLDTTLNPCIQSAYHAISIDERRASFVPTLWTNPDGSPRDNDDKVQQVWFPGVHCDVGGSYAECGLSNITLRWMSDNAKACGLQFDEQRLAACVGPKPFTPLAEAHDEWKPFPWGIAQTRAIPKNAVLANTVRLRMSGTGKLYKPANLDQPISSYRIAMVIPPDEL